MAGDDFDGAEVDRLVEQLAARSRAPRPALVPPHAGAPSSGATATSASSATSDASGVSAASATSATSAQEHRAPEPSRWTTARLLMPAVRNTEPRNTFGFASAIHLPALPQLSLPVLTDTQLSVLTARMFVGLGLALSAALGYWPYANTCSWGLMLYLSAVLLAVVTGVWGSKLTWDARLGAAHTLALCVVFWSLTLVMAEVLPRVGYAQIQEPWICPW